jgi:hypothetical protein
MGVGVELWLLEHYEDTSQLLPLGGIGATLLALGWNWRAPGLLSRRTLQVVLASLLVVGVTGVVLHVRGNAEFQREMVPSLAGWALWWKTLRAKAPPALAPGVLVQLALLGLVYAARPNEAEPRS